MLYGILCGAITGAAIFFFKLTANKVESLSRYLYSFAKTSPLYVVLAFALLILLALAMILIHKLSPAAKGGGIPRSEGVLRGVLSFKWLRTLIGTVSGSMISFFCGLPVGSEGPAVLIGTSLGSACLGKSKNKSAWSRYVMTGGAGAGFAIATGAPLSGVMFALEEIHKRFTPMLVLTVSVSVVSATYVNRLLCSLFNLSPSLFNTGVFNGFELKHVGYLMLLGLIIGLAVALYDVSVSLTMKFTEKFKKFLPAPLKMVILFMIVGVLGFAFTDGAYNGHHMINHLLEHNSGFAFLIALLAVRFVMMILVTDSGVTGGTFIPTLAIGAVYSVIISKLLILFGMPQEVSEAVILLGMCAFIGGTLRAPLTAAVLFIELTGQFTDIFFVALVIFTVNTITELLHLSTHYEIFLDHMVEEQNHGKEPKIAHFEMKICDDAFVIGKAVRDVMWPSSTVVISIKRADEQKKDMDNDGEKKLYAGDTIVIRSKYYDEGELIDLIHGLVGNDAEIHKIET